MSDLKCRNCSRPLYLLELMPGVTEWRHIGSNYLFCYPGSVKMPSAVAVPKEAA